MTTAAELIEDAMLDIGARSSRQDPTANEYADCLNRLNRMLASWSANGVLIPYLDEDEILLGSSAASYSIGSGGDLNTARPIEIRTAVIRRSGADYPLRKMDRRQYSRVADKDVEGLPSRYYFEADYALSYIYFDLMPAATDYLRLSSLKPLTSFSATTDTVTLPEGYELLIQSNLAINIAGMLGRGNAVPQSVIKTAKDSYDAVKKRNTINRVPVLEVDHALQRNTSYNINTE